MSLEKMTYDAATGTVIYRSKMHAGLKRNFQKLPRTPAPRFPAAESVEPVSGFAARAKAAWARLIRKVYEVDSLECPKCQGPMPARHARRPATPTEARALPGLRAA